MIASLARFIGMRRQAATKNNIVARIGKTQQNLIRSYRVFAAKGYRVGTVRKIQSLCSVFRPGIAAAQKAKAYRVLHKNVYWSFQQHGFENSPDHPG
jgi:hypothetical protein